jgi:hypothetical protein
LTAGKCGAALIHEQNIMRAFSGDHVEKDCADKKLSAQNYTVLCELTETGLPDKTRDCKRYLAPHFPPLPYLFFSLKYARHTLYTLKTWEGARDIT